MAPYGTLCKQMKLSTVAKLKLISLLMGMMFWYGIEQLFLDKVLRDPSARAWITFVFTATWLVFDIPGGILADTFGRRRTLIVSSMLQIVGVAVLAVSQSLPVYLFGAFLYGLHWSTFSGTIQAYMYDHLLLSERHKEYAKHQGSVTAYGFIGAGIANILSGIIADHSSLRMPFGLSLIPSVLALMLVISLSKVTETKTDTPRQIRSYVTELTRTIRQNPIAGVYAAQIIIGLFVFLTICEFGQIFLLSFNSNATWLGIIWAIDAAVVALALHFAHHVQRWPWQTVLLYASILTSFAIVHSPVAIILFMLVYAGTEVMHNISETELQHVAPSHARATVLSSVTFIGNLLALPLIFIFNSLFRSHSIHTANQFIALSAAVLLVISSIIIARSRRNQTVSQ